MKKAICSISLLFALTTGGLVLSSFLDQPLSVSPDLKFPYRNAGLSEREAAAHLLNRFSFGPRPGEVDAVVRQGLESWFEQQMAANLADDSLNKMLQEYESLQMSNEDILKNYPRPAQVLR